MSKPQHVRPGDHTELQSFLEFRSHLSEIGSQIDAIDRRISEREREESSVQNELSRYVRLVRRPGESKYSHAAAEPLDAQLEEIRRDKAELLRMRNRLRLELEQAQANVPNGGLNALGLLRQRLAEAEAESEQIDARLAACGERAAALTLEIQAIEEEKEQVVRKHWQDAGASGIEDDEQILSAVEDAVEGLDQRKSDCRSQLERVQMKAAGIDVLAISAAEKVEQARTELNGLGSWILAISRQHEARRLAERIEALIRKESPMLAALCSVGAGQTYAKSIGEYLRLNEVRIDPDDAHVRRVLQEHYYEA